MLILFMVMYRLMRLNYLICRDGKVGSGSGYQNAPVCLLDASRGPHNLITCLGKHYRQRLEYLSSRFGNLTISVEFFAIVKCK